MAWNVVTKTVNGNKYLYNQRSYRVQGEKNPRTEAKYLGRADGDNITMGQRARGVAEKITHIPEKTTKIKRDGTPKEPKKKTFLEKLRHPTVKKVVKAIDSTVGYIGNETIIKTAAQYKEELFPLHKKKKPTTKRKKVKKIRPRVQPRINVAISHKGIESAIRSGIKQGIKEGVAEVRAANTNKD